MCVGGGGGGGDYRGMFLCFCFFTYNWPGKSKTAESGCIYEVCYCYSVSTVSVAVSSWLAVFVFYGPTTQLYNSSVISPLYLI